jgi:hypothetical protein
MTTIYLLPSWTKRQIARECGLPPRLLRRAGSIRSLDDGTEIVVLRSAVIVTRWAK